MMNLVTFQKVTTGDVRTIDSYNTMDEALSALYNKMWYSVADANCTSTICLILDDEGRQHKYEKWEREATQQAQPAQQAQPEQENAEEE